MVAPELKGLRVILRAQSLWRVLNIPDLNEQAPITSATGAMELEMEILRHQDADWSWRVGTKVSRQSRANSTL